MKTQEQDLKLAVVCGGDGTLNICLNALHNFSDLKFVFLPYGTMNIFAREHRYPRSRVKALRLMLEEGEERMIYPGHTSQGVFMLMKSVGFDSYLVYKVEDRANKLKAYCYFYAFLKYALRYNFKRQFNVVVDDDKEYHGNFAVICNCWKYGGFLQLVPKASFFDEFFYIFVFRGKNFFSILRLCIQVFFKRHRQSSRVDIIRGKKVRIEGEGYTQMDGEKGNPLPVEMKKEKGVTFVLP
ncbi:MAG: hypothetical protein CVV50_05160 [Spirochaetae bacterium HGW-Spirochaetae-6]|nr:MAG: hypothetical protein CVV50_05160 [Spirochaetae bacterium HGW-Spirochaetae-6]